VSILVFSVNLLKFWLRLHFQPSKNRATPLSFTTHKHHPVHIRQHVTTRLSIRRTERISHGLTKPDHPNTYPAGKDTTTEPLNRKPDTPTPLPRVPPPSTPDRRIVSRILPSPIQKQRTEDSRPSASPPSSQNVPNDCRAKGSCYVAEYIARW
jgi:hypothetical protein